MSLSRILRWAKEGPCKYAVSVTARSSRRGLTRAMLIFVRACSQEAADALAQKLAYQAYPSARGWDEHLFVALPVSHRAYRGGDLSGYGE